ncbi:MCE family protein [Aquabacterium soli]|jgi:paraquat-inducible protein B|uniref:MCE family protein n=1 Tax=Aquabacterium soli TaxID=2493092 RepID=A0A426VHJ9_9BURK|nr:MlaD family protein [Aquabacterium soli]RRS06309.1 MCE family protein [Aquabacterium soli]
MKRNALMIGLFVLVSLALGALAITFLGGNRLFEQRTRAVVYFTNSVKGLYVGAPVTFRGVPIGQVDAIGIELDPNSLVTRVPVQLFITSKLLQMSGGDTMDLGQLVQRGLRARLAQQSLVTGQALIDLDFDPQTPLALVGDKDSKSVEIPVVKGAFDDLVAQITELPLKDTVGDLRSTLAALQSTSAEAQKVMKQAGEDWRQASLAAQQILRNTDRTLQTVGTQANATLASVQRLSDTTNSLVAATQPDIARTLSSTRDAARSVEVGMQSFSELSAPGSPPREDLESTLRDLSQTARSLRQVAELLENQPNALIFGRR